MCLLNQTQHLSGKKAINLLSLAFLPKVFQDHFLVSVEWTLNSYFLMITGFQNLLTCPSKSSLRKIHPSAPSYIEMKHYGRQPVLRKHWTTAVCLNVQVIQHLFHYINSIFYELCKYKDNGKDTNLGILQFGRVVCCFKVF